MKRILPLKKLLPQNAFARGVAVLLGGTAAAQLILLLAAPVLTRLYSPEDFGVLAVFVSILSILGVVASLRYELAIPIADNEQTALNLVALCLFITTGMAFFTALAVLLLGDWLASLLSISEFATYLWLLPVGVFLIGIYQTFSYWATREKAFGRISKTKLTQSISSLIIQLSCFKLGPIGLIAGYITGQFFGASRLAKSAFDKLDKKSLSTKSLQSVGARYRRFPIFTTWASFFNTVGMQLPPLLLTSFFGLSAVGVYSLAHRLLMLPGALFSQAFSQVFLSYGASFSREGELGKQVDHFLEVLIGIALPPAVLMIFYAPYFFEIVFGEEWKQAGEVARWMIFSTFFMFCNTPLTVFLILERQDLGLYMQIVLLILRSVGIALGVIFSDFMGTIILYSLMSAIGYLIFLIIKIVVSNGSVTNFVKKFIFHLIITLSVFLPVISIDITQGSLGLPSSISVLLTVIMLMVYYGQIIKRFNLKSTV